MMRHPRILLLLLCVMPAAHPAAQPWMEGLPEGERDFNAIRSAFEEYWKGRDHKEKGKGWKPFKRWEWFWAQRVHPGGILPEPGHLYEEYIRIASRRGKATSSFSGNWTEMGPSASPGGYAGLGRINCVRTDPLHASVIWAGSASGGLWKSTNSGGSWVTATDELPSLGVTDIAIHPTAPQTMYIATGDGDAGDTYSVGVLKSTDGGASWNTTGLGWQVSQTRRISRLLMHPSDPNTLLAAGTAGIHKTTNGGGSWTQVSTLGMKDMEFRPGTPSTIYASRSNGQVYRSTNTGGAWTQLSNGIPTSGGRVALGVTPADGAVVYALYALSSNSGFSGLYRSSDAGTSWALMSSTPNLLGWSETGSDAGGQGWYDLAVAVSQTNPLEVYVGGVNNWKSTDGGATWNIISMWYGTGGIPEVHADQHDLCFVPGTSTLYAGNDGGVYRTVNGGSTWTWLGSGLRCTQFYRLGVSQTSAGVLIAGSQDNGTKALGAGIWDDVIGGDGMECIVDYTNASIMYGSLYYGDLYRSTNGGTSFSYISGGISESGSWVTPYALHPSNPSILYAGYTNVWKSTNRGGSWTSVSSFSSGTLDGIAIAPSDPSVIYLSNGSALFRTTDGGASGWSSLASPTGNFITSIAVHPGSPFTLWVTASGYSSGAKVYASTDGGSTWSNISGSLPNVPANTVVYEEESPGRLYVGTDIGVWYRDNTTADWVDFNTGLANVVVNELEIQKSSGRIRAATFGRGIWESDLVPASAPLAGVSPDSLTASLEQGDSTVQTLTISNGGGLPLLWSIGTGAPPAPWIRAVPASGTVGPGLSQPVSVTLHTPGPPGTVHRETLLVASNDTLHPVKQVGVRVTVLVPTQTVQVPVREDWNLISVPVRASDMRKTTLFPLAVSPAYSFGMAPGYELRDTLRTRWGYWLKFPAAGSAPVTGEPVSADTIPVEPGWNLIGSVTAPTVVWAVIPLGTTVESPFYDFATGGYAVLDTLLPGRGSWVKVSTGGSLLLGTPARGLLRRP
ncbi:MAG: hypothetical protein WB626_10675 [Bacteroidota bacterium]